MFDSLKISTSFDPRFSDLELIRSTHEFQRFITVPAQGCDDQRAIAHVFALRLATSDAWTLMDDKPVL